MKSCVNDFYPILGLLECSSLKHPALGQQEGLHRTLLIQKILNILTFLLKTAVRRMTMTFRRLARDRGIY